MVYKSNHMILKEIRVESRNIMTIVEHKNIMIVMAKMMTRMMMMMMSMTMHDNDDEEDNDKDDHDDDAIDVVTVWIEKKRNIAFYQI